MEKDFFALGIWEVVLSFVAQHRQYVDSIPFQTGFFYGEEYLKFLKRLKP